MKFFKLGMFNLNDSRWGRSDENGSEKPKSQSQGPTADEVPP